MPIDPRTNAPRPGTRTARRSILREPRVLVPVDAAQRVVVEGIGSSGDAGRLVDVSRSGLRVTAAAWPSPDDHVHLALRPPGGDVVSVHAIVRWWRPAAEGLGEGGLRIEPGSQRSWEELLKRHVAPTVQGSLLPLAPQPHHSRVAVVGPDPEAAARLAARLASAGLEVPAVTGPAGGETPGGADVIVAGPYGGEAEAKDALRALLVSPGLESALTLVLLPGADAAARRSVVEAGAFDCVTTPDGGDEVALRLLVALRLCRQRQQARAAADRLAGRSSRDPLTGLANRRQFLALAADERRRAQRLGEPLALLLLDVDHFKQVNDLYGHRTGDAALRMLARLLRRHLRLFDIVGRFGGDEFIVLLSGAGRQGSLTAAERIRSLIASMAIDEHRMIRLTASVGVVSSEPPHAVPVAQLLTAVDRALYRAKHAGRNQVRSGVVGTTPRRGGVSHG